MGESELAIHMINVSYNYMQIQYDDADIFPDILTLSHSIINMASGEVDSIALHQEVNISCNMVHPDIYCVL